MILERRDGTIVGIEAKASATAGGADFHGLRLMRERLGERFAFGALLYTGPATVPFGDRLAAIPLQGLWEPFDDVIGASTTEALASGPA